jgi:hypothetical protein
LVAFSGEPSDPAWLENALIFVWSHFPESQAIPLGLKMT